MANNSVLERRRPLQSQTNWIELWKRGLLSSDNVSGDFGLQFNTLNSVSGWKTETFPQSKYFLIFIFTTILNYSCAGTSTIVKEF